MKLFKYKLLALSLFLVSSCSTENTPIYQLTVTSSPSEAGSVSPASGEYEEGEQVTITATPNEHWVFDKWSGDHSGTSGSTSVIMDNDKAISALFTKKEYSLTVNIEGEGTVSERIIQAKTTDYAHGTVVELMAEANDGWEFVEWQGDVSGDENPTNISVLAETTVIAIFAEALFEVNIEIEGDGVVKITPEKESYKFGDQLEISVEPAEGWNFVYWDGLLEGTDNPIEVIINQNISATASLDESPFAGGDGSEMYPYHVSTLSQLQAVRDFPNKNFIQLNNIDATETSSWNNGEGFNPIGNQFVRFTGVYDGKNHDISNLFIDRSNIDDNVAMFGFVENSRIANVVLKNISIKSLSNAASLVGVNYGHVENSFASGTVVGNSGSGLIGSNFGTLINVTSTVSVTAFYSGGLVNYNDNNAVIRNSSSHGVVIGENGAGGLVQTNYGQIHLSYSTGKVQSSYNAGGLASWSGGLISQSYSVGKVLGLGNEIAGGLVGTNDGLIIESYYKGEVSGTNKVGGLVGFNQSGIIQNSYSKASVIAKSDVGGAIGINSSSGSIQQSYSIGAVLGDSNIGASIGVNGGNADDLFWNLDLNEKLGSVGFGSSEGILSLNLSGMTGSEAQENMPEFDWDNVWKTVDGDYPILRWQDE